MTFLGPEGAKADLEKRKIIFGTAKGSAIWLAPAGSHVLVAEGNEKTLACMSASGLPGISGGSSSIMVSVTIPPETGTITICADRGAAGEESAQKLAARLYDEGLEVRICFPPVEGKDWDECPRRTCGPPSKVRRHGSLGRWKKKGRPGRMARIAAAIAAAAHVAATAVDREPGMNRCL